MSEVFCQTGEGGCQVNGKPVGCLCGGDFGHGYFCHTPKDGCIDDSDCADGQGTCNFDQTSKTWLCSVCFPPV
jgi:hypothetical protein